MRPNVNTYSASAPMPPSIQTITAPARAHNNTSPAAVDTRREDTNTNIESVSEEVVHADGASAEVSSRDAPLQSGCSSCGREPANKIDKYVFLHYIHFMYSAHIVI